MFKLITITLALALTGCAGTMNAVALNADRADMCQTGIGSEQRRIELGRPVGYTAPSYCYSSRPTHRITDAHGRTIGYIK